jgi:predicted nucleic acid-binding protein
MTGKLKFYWDTAPLIAWITDEKRSDPTEMDGLAEVVDLVEKGKAVLVTSVLWRAEVLSGSLTAPQRLRLKQVFDYRLIEEVGVDSRIMDLVAEIRAFHRKDTSKTRLKNVRVPDAIHLATAIHFDVQEFHTFDGKRADGVRAGLLTLDGDVAGHRLKICAPHAQQLRLQYSSGEEAEPEATEGESD